MNFLHFASLAVFYLMANVIFFIFIRLPVTHQLIEISHDNEIFKLSEVIDQDKIIQIGQGLTKKKKNCLFIILFDYNFIYFNIHNR